MGRLPLCVPECWIFDARRQIRLPTPAAAGTNVADAGRAESGTRPVSVNLQKKEEDRLGSEL
jgi:hypothetical protein